MNNKKKKTILYVDDCVNQLNLMRENLEDYNIGCYTACNGIDGYRVYLNNREKIFESLLPQNSPVLFFSLGRQ